MASFQYLLILFLCSIFVIQVNCQQKWAGDRAPLLKQLQRLEKILTKISKLDGFMAPGKHSGALSKEVSCGSRKFNELSDCCKESKLYFSTLNSLHGKCSKLGVNVADVNYYFLNQAQSDAKLEVSDSSSGVAKTFGKQMKYMECIFSSAGAMTGSKVNYASLTSFLKKGQKDSGYTTTVSLAVNTCSKSVPGLKAQSSMEPLLSQQCVLYQLLSSCNSPACSDQKSKLQACNPF